MVVKSEKARVEIAINKKMKISTKRHCFFDYKATIDYGGVVPFISAIVSAEGLQNSNLSSGTSSSLSGANLSSPSTAETSIGAQHRNLKPLQIGSTIYVSQTNSLLLQSIDSSSSSRPRRSSARDGELLYARQEIENARVSRKVTVLHASVYQNISKFESQVFDFLFICNMPMFMLNCSWLHAKYLQEL
ncbi:hypothetical protein PVK06_017976 [Gossypium arboreum]|uniref:Uncharacterized protein n=1 Tax=Gossypium arboreum TaxID=29729 RepID=A0ABR0Q475_GOSAR|nr:hypothetical protein PVK06_017976 [Gossypium arboreum]